MVVLKQLCKVCGKEFITSKGSGVVTCEDCRGTVLKLRTFGEKQCVWCGKTFIANSPRQTSCGDVHYLPCPDCGTAVEVKETYQNFMKNGGKPRRCSACRAKAISKTHKSFSEEKKDDIKRRTIATTRSKYGTDYAMQSDEIKHKAKQRIQELYGVDNLGQSPEIRKKVDKTVNEKYGGYTLASPILRKKVEATNLDKYGVKNPLQSADIRDKVKSTNLKKYGVENPFQSVEMQTKIHNTCIQRYGVSHPMSNSDIKFRATATNLVKYGATMYPISKEYMVKVMSDPTKIDSYMEFNLNPRKYIESNYESKPTLKQVAYDIGVTDTTMSDIIIRHNCKDLISYFVSSMEQEISNVLQMIDSNIEIVHNDRQLIKPQELDIYLPQYNIAIECNPTYTHNSSFDTVWGNDKKGYKYHQQKTEKCECEGIRLVHIFGYQWNNKRDVVVSMLRNMLHKNLYRLFARDMVVKEVTSKDVANFLDINHIQGRTSATVRLGLYHEDKLISLMTFSKPRYSIGFKASYDSNTWELTRFCTLLNTTCVGGAGKLFKHFLKVYQPSMVTSFSDRSITTGNLYKVLGFEFDSYVDPGYVWVNADDDSFYTRVTCQKKNLPSLFNEPDLDIEHHTESQIMESHGFVQVYNSGLIKWLYNNKSS